MFPKSDESCWQLLANWGARTGRHWAVNLGAGLNAFNAALDFTIDPSNVGTGGVSAAGGLLFRFGEEAETAEKLSTDAAAAEKAGFPHGVSTTTRVPTKTAASSAERAEVEEHFPVQQTGRDPAHHTVVLPKPVTQEIANLFNRLFGRTPGGG